MDRILILITNAFISHLERRVSGRRMTFTQNVVDCVIRIQRTWRLSFRHKTTERLVLALVTTNCSNSVLESAKRWEGGFAFPVCRFADAFFLFCRVDKIRELIYDHKTWLVYFKGLERITLILHSKSKEPMARRSGTVVCLRMMYDILHSRINTFLGDGSVDFGFHLHALNLSRATEHLVDSLKHICLHRDARFSIDAVPGNDLRAYHECYKAFYCAILHRYNENNLKRIPFLKKNVSACTAVHLVLDERRGLDAHSRAVHDSVLKSANHLARMLGKLLEKQSGKERHSLEVSLGTEELVRRLKERHGWALMTTDDEFLVSRALMDRRFVFAASHGLESLSIDMQDQQAHSIIAAIENEMEVGIDATKTLSVFWTYLEGAMRRVAVAMGKQSEIAGFTLGEVRAEWSAGRTTWMTVVRTLDAAVADLKLLDQGSGRRWAGERPRIIAKKPSPVQAFVNGLRCVWSVWKEVNVAGINAVFRSTIARLSNFELYRRLSDSFQRRMVLWGFECDRTKELVKEVAETFPSFKQRIMQRSKGSRFAFHGLMVAHVVFRRSRPLVPAECPETMALWGKQLKRLQDRIRLFCDAAIIISVCAGEELDIATNYIRKFTQRELLPIFMPISQGSIDRAEYALKNKRGTFEKEFTKLFTLHALRLSLRTLPGNLGVLQEWANFITTDLGKVIRMDRGVHFARYSAVINAVCQEFSDE